MSRSKVSRLNMQRKMLGAQRLQDLGRGQFYLDFAQRREKGCAGTTSRWIHLIDSGRTAKC